ncbi:hypothetical protein PSN45_003182 [Yamadazyma tenuis]|uniref:Nucleoporin Pom152 n=1 Tax=Candida tenuis (strain ATCC 10573 / BCRC 21748 / CBS 615 / JCM 9827 / NBRC 10315 / NRRL Y-1498 / VKM Y-70) TaxID=590646 RepID=G3AZ42_CANTC|nr:uncharacterized protein CANTEDRAFT_101861 [Yamadazyma tenuis ATCC 10573]EGV66003.1 hypothetical protein CANTEDRAFT_101861 [Yamadazyma tenuis ATCC 10573]WEJ95658.1 hypothetical protein PSN45_003182 [Yamadazyma tenuis]
MERSGKKRVRIDDTVTEIRSARQYSPPTNRQSNPLIPVHILDEAFQRILLVSVFVLIQAWKLYDAMLLNTIADDSVVGSSLSRMTFVLKYLLIDGLFLWFLPILNLQYLSFSPLVTLLFTLILNLFNILLASKLNMSLFMVVVGPYFKSLKPSKELTVAGDAINPKVIDMDSHFKGKYTIQYLPDSLAKFNVFDLHSVCQDPEEKIPFQIPIEFNTTTDLGLLEIQYTSPENKVSQIVFQESDLHKLINKDYSHLKSNKKYVKDDYRVFYLEIPVREPGSYKISIVRDKSGTNMRYVQNEFSFAYCPGASFILPKSYASDTNNKACVGFKLDDLSMKLPLITFYGSPPLVTKIGTTINGKSNKVIDAEISLETLDTLKFNFTSQFSHKITRNSLEQEILKDPKMFNVKESSTIQFQILEIKDSLGNVKRYNPQSDSSDLRYNLNLLTKPSLRLIDMDSSKKLLVNGTKDLSFATSSNIREQLPFTAYYAYESVINPELSFNFSHKFSTFADLQKGISVSNPGIYKLLRVSGKYCECEVQPSAINLETILPPSLEIQAEPLVDNCVGMTGYNFKFNAKGSAPFTVEYSVYQNSSSGTLRPLPGPNGRIKRLLKSSSNDFDFAYKPPGEGNYVVRFEAIRDYDYYDSPTLLNEKEHTYSTYFKQRSKVSFFDRQSNGLQKTINLCKGESTRVPVYFTGSFPFTFDYSLIDKNSGKNILTKLNQKAYSRLFEIDTKDITFGGIFDVVLANVVDANSCATDFDGKEKVQIVARSDVPEISFDVKQQVSYHKIVEGDFIDIPLSTRFFKSKSGTVEFEVSNLENLNDKRTETVQVSTHMTISKPGIYKLVSFTDGKCHGKISDIEKAIHVSFHPRPQIRADADKSITQSSSTNESLLLISGCQGCKRQATVHFEGKGPFMVDYEIKFPSGKTDSRTMTSDKSKLLIDLPTDNSGLYEHRFKRIFDGLYTRSKSPDRGFKPQIISYEVLPAPSIVFEKMDVLKLCEASLSKYINELDSLSISVSGKAPFSAQIMLIGDSLEKKFTIENINGPTINLNDAVDSKNVPIWKYLKQGEYELSITQVSDSNRCEKKTQNLSTLILSISPAPDVTKFDQSKSYYCVGDHVGYDLLGEPPFTLSYEFQGTYHKAQTTNEFRRLAAKPGIIHVSSMEDSSAGKCMVNIEPSSQKYKDLEIVIHDLPSVEVNHGDYISQNIHEGDQTELKFSFTGTPPFSITYVRTLDPNVKAKRTKNSKLHKGVNKIIETQTINNIKDHEYTVMVGLEGTYEAIEVKDKYCMAKREFSYE